NSLCVLVKIAHLIARESRPFSIGPFIKQCIAAGAAAMIERNAGFVGRLKSKFMRQSRQEIHSIHCIIHQETLCAKSLKCDVVMKIVIKVVNFIRTTELNHRQFREFLSS
ncbi:GTD2B protein, partial [Acromyrmex heyeri]